jgi:hypothetical protein
VRVRRSGTRERAGRPTSLGGPLRCIEGGLSDPLGTIIRGVANDASNHSRFGIGPGRPLSGIRERPSAWRHALAPGVISPQGASCHRTSHPSHLRLVIPPEVGNSRPYWPAARAAVELLLDHVGLKDDRLSALRTHSLSLSSLTRRFETGQCPSISSGIATRDTSRSRSARERAHSSGCRGSRRSSRPPCALGDVGVLDHLVRRRGVARKPSLMYPLGRTSLEIDGPPERE